MIELLLVVTAGLGPAVHASGRLWRDVDVRHKAGHDDNEGFGQADG